MDRQQTTQGVQASVVHGHHQPDLRYPFTQDQTFQVLPHAVLVGAHQTARAQLYATKPAADHDTDFAHRTVQQNLQHGPSGRAVGLAVVRRTDLRRMPRRARHIGPAIVGCIGVATSQRLHKGPRRSRPRRMRALSQKTAAANDKLGAVGRVWRSRRHGIPAARGAHAQARKQWEAVQSMSFCSGASKLWQWRCR